MIICGTCKTHDKCEHFYDQLNANIVHTHKSDSENTAAKVTVTINEKQCNLQKNDPVSHPSHYTDGKIEVIDFINDKKLNFNRGNAIKYISRAGKKDPNKEIEDLQKAVFYLNDEIKRLQQAKKW